MSTRNILETLSSIQIHVLQGIPYVSRQFYHKLYCRSTDCHTSNCWRRLENQNVALERYHKHNPGVGDDSPLHMQILQAGSQLSAFCIEVKAPDSVHAPWERLENQDRSFRYHQDDLPPLDCASPLGLPFSQRIGHYQQGSPRARKFVYGFGIDWKSKARPLEIISVVFQAFFWLLQARDLFSGRGSAFLHGGMVVVVFADENACTTR